MAIGKALGAEIPFGELKEHISRASALISLYGKHANSEPKTEPELLGLQQEMRVIKNEILSELASSRRLIQQVQKESRDSR